MRFKFQQFLLISEKIFLCELAEINICQLIQSINKLKL
jgi:hypothetical protein